jgi:hypothetical protein
VGLIPIHLVRPAFPIVILFTSALPITPIVAKHSFRTKRISLDGNLKVTYLPSFASIFALVPAALTICPPRLGTNSML